MTKEEWFKLEVGDLIRSTVELDYTPDNVLRIISIYNTSDYRGFTVELVYGQAVLLNGQPKKGVWPCTMYKLYERYVRQAVGRINRLEI